jgi:hypothetical protein
MVILDQSLTKNCREYGLPVQVRDAALGRKNQAPTSDINKRQYSCQDLRPHQLMPVPLRILYPEPRSADGRFTRRTDTRLGSRQQRGKGDVEIDGKDRSSLQEESTAHLQFLCQGRL